jgi:Trypsin-like peptidase domain
MGMPHKWKLEEEWVYNLGSLLRRQLSVAIDEGIPELRNDLPGRHPFSVKGRRSVDLLAIHWESTGPSTVNSFGQMKEDEFQRIRDAVGSSRFYSQLVDCDELKEYYSESSLLLVLDVVNDEIDLNVCGQQLIDWANDKPLPAAERLNAARVRRAIPAPPAYSLDLISKAVWVIESSSADVQGTAFRLENIGFVTCEHVLFCEDKLAEDAILLHPADLSQHYKIKDVISSARLDLAIFQAEVPQGSMLSVETTDPPLQSHVAVCGYPNFRYGDTCTLSQGVVVAHRMARGGIRRLLTNAGIVAGMSGGPAIGEGNRVLGVCVTGAPTMQKTRETEDQSIIPISAIDLLI